MCYCVNNYSSYGLYLTGEKDISAFIEKAISVFKEEGSDWYSIEDIEIAAAEIHSEKDLAKKARAFAWLIDDSLPFEMDFEESNPKIDGDRPVLRVYYVIAAEDQWEEEPVELMLKALAPFMKEGNYLGFVDEDGGMWSYVFDGKGSYTYARPVIDWTGGLYPAAK
jgi:hypothetical protein